MLTFDKFVNESKREFYDISSERIRVYYLAEQDVEITIEEPLAVSHSESGHYIVDKTGRVTRIPFKPDYDIMSWEVHEGYPNVVV